MSGSSHHSTPDPVAMMPIGLEHSHPKGRLANIPSRCNRNEPICFSPYLYRARNLLERLFNKIRQCRRIATRYDKLAALSRLQTTGSIRLCLRVDECTPELIRTTPSLVLDDSCLKSEQTVAQELHLTNTLRESGDNLKQRQQRSLPERPTGACHQA
jgi:hypothetical protein